MKRDNTKLKVDKGKEKSIEYDENNKSSMKIKDINVAKSVTYDSDVNGIHVLTSSSLVR